MVTVNYDGRLINLEKYLPLVADELYELKAICDSETVEFGFLFDEMLKSIDNSFIFYTDEEGIARWEKMLGILPTSNLLEERQFTVYAKLNATAPYTKRALDKILTDLCGSGEYELEILGDTYEVNVKIPFVSKQITAQITSLLRNIVPANMQLFVEDAAFGWDMDTKRVKGWDEGTWQRS